MPERTCVSCRKKGEKEDFFRISEKEGNYVFDKEMKIQSRGFYICKSPSCIEKLSKNRKYNIEMQELLKLLKETEKKRKNIIDIIRPMKNSGFFVFGIDETIDGIKREKIKLVVIPKDIKSKYIEEFKKLSEKFNFKTIFIEKKAELIELFSRDVNVVGIFDKKVIKGILSKVEVMNG